MKLLKNRVTVDVDKLRNIRSKKEKETLLDQLQRAWHPLTRDFSNLSRRGLSRERFTPPIIIPRFSVVSFTSRRCFIYSGPFGTRGFSKSSPRRHDSRTRNIDDRSRLRRWTYQDSHFCSRDVPGASRSELDADCRRFLALYTRHTFAFATRGPVGSGAPSRIPPRYTSLFSYDDDGPTVPSDHHSPLGQTPHSPSPTNTRAAKKRFSPSSTNGFRSLPPSSSAHAMLNFFFFSRRISSQALAAL